MECFGSDPLLDTMNSKLITRVFSGKCSAGSEPHPAKDFQTGSRTPGFVPCIRSPEFALPALQKTVVTQSSRMQWYMEGSIQSVHIKSQLHHRERKGEYKHGCRKERRASEQG